MDNKENFFDEDVYAGAPGLDPELEWAEEFDNWEKDAARGDVLASFNLAKCYENGTYVERSYPKAAELYMSVAESNDESYSGDPQDSLWPQCDACFRLGFLYENGLLPDSTMQKAVQWYDRAAYDGSVEACFKMAEICMGGGEEVNYDDVAKYLCLVIPPYYTDERFFSLASRLFAEAEEFTPWGIIDALAECFENGFGTAVDHARAKEYREKAAVLRGKQDVIIKARLKGLLFPENG